MYRPSRVTNLPAVTVQAIKKTYRQLCVSFLHASPGHPFYDYVQSAIANEATLDRHVRAFELYAPFVAPGMRLLDWGCRQAPDSCMMRSLTRALALHGCDV